MENRHKLPLQILGFLTALMMILSVMLVLPSGMELTAQAISSDYPVQLMNLASKDNSKVLTENGTTDNSAVVMEALGNDLSPSWRFDRVGADENGTYFKICNVQSGRLLSPLNYNVSAGASVVVYGYESAKSQHWFVVPVKTDHLGNNLYYKIVNYSNTSLALTQGTNGMTLANYTGADNQLFLLNADGLQGFAGYCSNDNTNQVKAADIGGLFGETVEVSNFANLKKYAEASEPYTIVITGKIDGGSNYKIDGQNHYYNPDGRIYVTDNKTIIGSYNSHVLYNTALCTKQGSGKGNNIIFRNLEIQHDKDSNGNDNISVYFGAGQNLWLDHVYFVGHDDYNKASSGQPDYDKFLAVCYDADYCTVSDSSFGLHEYGIILGYPDDAADAKAKYDGYPRITLAGNKFYQTLTRGPGLMRWGYYHSFNNYVDTFSMAYTVYSGCNIYAENCYYANGGNVICDWNQITYPGAYYETGSKFFNCYRTARGEGTTNNPSYSVESTWRPENNYSYVTLTADQTKSYCSAYSGSQSSNGNWIYIRYGTKSGVPSADFYTEPEEPIQPTTEEPTESVTPSREKKFVEGGDNWSFSNSRTNFGDTYFMQDSYYQKLLNGLNHIEKEKIYDAVRNTRWGGSCYGMATTSVLASNAVLNPADYQENANFLHDISAPPSDEVKSLINYYFMLQFTDEIQNQTRQSAYESEEEKLKKLISCLEDDSPALLTYFGYFNGSKFNYGGHGVVAYGIEYGTYSKDGKAYNGKILTYDNNVIDYDESYCLYFNTSNWSWVIPYYQLDSSKGSTLGFISDDVNLLNAHGYLNGGTYQNSASDYIAMLDADTMNEDYSIHKVNYSNGTWINAPTAEDDIKLFSSLSDTQETNNLCFALKDAGSGYVMEMNSPTSMDLSMNYENTLLNATASKGLNMCFSPKGCIFLEGENTNYNMQIVLNESELVTDWYSFSVSGGNAAAVKFEKTKGGYILTSPDMKNIIAESYNDEDDAFINFSTDADSVFLYEIDKNTIGVKVDSNGDGTYDNLIAQTPESITGDANLDGTVDILDVITINKAILGKETLTRHQNEFSDINENGVPDSSDALAVLKYIVGLTSGLK